MNGSGSGLPCLRRPIEEGFSGLIEEGFLFWPHFARSRDFGKKHFAQNRDLGRTYFAKPFFVSSLRKESLTKNVYHNRCQQ